MLRKLARDKFANARKRTRLHDFGNRERAQHSELDLDLDYRISPSNPFQLVVARVFLHEIHEPKIILWSVEATPL